MSKLIHNHWSNEVCGDDCPVKVYKDKHVAKVMAAQQAPFMPDTPQSFTYYLHDNTSNAELREYIEEKGIVLSEEAWENMGKPFYEVGIHCEVDPQGNVTIVGAS